VLEQQNIGALSVNEFLKPKGIKDQGLSIGAVARRLGRTLGDGELNLMAACPQPFA
jgi:hypothetical protein